VPPNCQFLIDDADKDWLFTSHFDFIHSRAMIAAFKDWPRFIDQAFAHLKPGGYIEIQDFFLPTSCLTNPGLMPEQSPFMQWSHTTVGAGLKIGIDMHVPGNLGDALHKAGFRDIQRYDFAWPVGGEWPKSRKQKLLGRFAYQDLMEWLPSSAMRLYTRVLGWEAPAVEAFLAEVKEEIASYRDCFYQPSVFWVARKPLSEDEGVDIEQSGELVVERHEEGMVLEIDPKWLERRKQ
jgi:SAM-dependent methyltransferase